MKNVFVKYLSVASILVFAGIVAGCGNNKEADNGLQVLDIEQAMDNVTEVKMSSYFSAIEYVPLETKADVLVTDVSMTDMFHSEDRVYIMNHQRVGASTIMSFDNEGNSLPFNAKAGRAEGEYTQGWHLMTFKDGVYLIDMSSIIKYDKEGNYLASIPVENGFRLGYRSAAAIDDRLIYISEDKTDRDDKLHIFDNDDNLVLQRSLGEYKVVTGMRNIGVGGSSIQVISRLRSLQLVSGADKAILLDYSDTIYSVNEQTGDLHAEYVASLGKYDIGKNSPAIRSMFLETPAFTLYRVVFGAAGFPNISQEERLVTCLYDRATGKNFSLKRLQEYASESHLNAMGFVNDLDGGMLFSPVKVYGNKMYQLVNAYKFIEYAKATGSKAMLDVATKLDEESNPVMVVATLK